LNYRSTNWL